MKIYEIEKVGLGLTIFDIDDTLFHTTAQISVMKDGKVVRTLSNQEYNVYTLQPGESFDYGEFRNAEKFNKESVPIGPMIAKLKAILKNAGDSTVIMLTARNDFDNKELFLDTFKKYGIDMSKIHVHRSGSLGLPSAEGKAVWIRKYLDTGKYGRVRLYDDAMSNLKMLIGLRQEYPDVQFFPYLVTPEGSIRTVKEVTNPPEVAESRLNEVFNQPYPWTWTSSGKNRSIWIAEFNDVDVMFDFQKSLGVWNMSFDRNNVMTATGEGDQFKIFATVIDIAKDFVRQMQPEKFSFYAQKDPDETTSSRPKLYSAMVKRFASVLGYDSKEQAQDDDYVTYLLTKKQDESVAEAAVKGTKAEANYQPNPKNGQKCINCTMWRDPNKCSAVAGNIDPAGWCDWYAGGAYGKRGNRVDEDGRIVPGVNTTVDVKPGETERQAAKFGNKLTKSGPPLLMAETRYTAKEWAILEGGHALEEKIVDHAPRKWFKV
jgi:hypothetical protein